MLNKKSYQWTVIGAGPAGIAAVGKLLECNVPAQEIAWIDPEFKVGQFGTLWREVPSNTKVGLFLKFLNGYKSFNFARHNQDFELLQQSPDETTVLKKMAEPLQWVSDQLKNQLQSFNDVVEHLALRNGLWEINGKQHQVAAHHVVLAIGAQPKILPYHEHKILPLKDAIDRQRLQKSVNRNHTVAVFGSSHSAILTIRHLIECPVKQVINFYRSPLRYAAYFDDWILHDDTGLKGSTAKWAREHIDGTMPDNLVRVYSDTVSIEHYLPMCDKVIYAIGFERNGLPVVEGVGKLSYDDKSGIIAPGLFGLGIAFPEAKMTPLGTIEHRVGLWKFMEYLNRVMPLWLNYGV